MKRQRVSGRGFTLIELLIAIAIFSLVIVAFITMFLVITRVQVRQSSLAEVNGQSQFLLQEMQYYIGRASLIDIPQDTPTTTLRLRMPDTPEDPTYLILQNGTLYLQQTQGGALQPLSSSKVNISNLSFTRHANPPGHDSVSIALTVTYNTSNLQQLFSEALQTSVARASQAVFDADVVPSSTATNSLGVPGNIWSSINGAIYFSGSNVGIGTQNPGSVLSVNGQLDMMGNSIINLPTPVNGTDAANKDYVDNKLGGAAAAPAGWTCTISSSSVSNGAGYVQANCTGSQKVISGGCSVPVGDTVTASEPVNQGWFCADANNAAFSAFANCCQ